MLLHFSWLPYWNSGNGGSWWLYELKIYYYNLNYELKIDYYNFYKNITFDVKTI